MKIWDPFLALVEGDKDKLNRTPLYLWNIEAIYLNMDDFKFKSVFTNFYLGDLK